ncbi:MAG: cation transporter [Oscillospiraceae bacterium]|nr:cation transporter [Oscillospiraceae bacterium]
MIKLIIRKYIKDSENVTDSCVRARYGILGGILGIICNLILFGIKLAAGLLLNSIAVISDAVNNLSDTGSSLVTIIGTKLSSGIPDKEHPYGHGRMEYISSLIIAFIIELAGFELLKSSFGKILNPEKVDFDLGIIIILSLSVLIKLWMFSYNRYMGRITGSSVLSAAASDSLNDVISTAAIILSTVIGEITSFPIDGYAGFAVSLLIMRSGIDIARSTIDRLIGSPPDKELTDKIKFILTETEGITGVHDLIIHDYGPGRIMASAHAEVSDTADIVEIHEIIDETENRILTELGVEIVLHTDPVSTLNEKVRFYRSAVENIVSAENPLCSIHDFRITDGKNRINLIFDLAVPFDIPPAERVKHIENIKKSAEEKFPEATAVIKVDTI